MEKCKRLPNSIYVIQDYWPCVIVGNFFVDVLHLWRLSELLSLLLIFLDDLFTYSVISQLGKAQLFVWLHKDKPEFQVSIMFHFLSQMSLFIYLFFYFYTACLQNKTSLICHILPSMSWMCFSSIFSHLFWNSCRLSRLCNMSNNRLGTTFVSWTTVIISVNCYRTVKSIPQQWIHM